MGWIYTHFSVPNGTAGGELQLPYRIRVPSRGLLRDYEPSDGTFSSTSEGAVRYFGHLMVSRLLARVTRACTTLGTVLELEHAGNSRESVARHRCTAPPCCLSSAHYPLPTSARLLQSLHHHCSDTGYLHPDIFRRYICRYLHKRLHTSRKEDNQRY